MSMSDRDLRQENADIVNRNEPALKEVKHSSQGANEYMIGGDHYRKVEGEQHWDRMWRLYGPGYFVGCITKYVERYHLKDGIKDLLKAQHYLSKLIELEQENGKDVHINDKFHYCSRQRDGRYVSVCGVNEPVQHTMNQHEVTCEDCIKTLKEWGHDPR